MSTELLILLQLSAAFLGLFVVSELLYHVLKVPAEYTRKVTHVGTGLLTLLFPVYLQELWQMFAICGVFLVLLLLSMKFNLLKSVNNIERKSLGSLLYPIIVVIVFCFYHYMQQHETTFAPKLYFYAPILIMAISDPVAAIVGRQYGKGPGKTYMGSAAFLLSAIAVSSVLLIVFSTGATDMNSMLLHTLAISLAAMAAERWSNGGWDNFTIPLAVSAYLWMIHLTGI